jgi:hypothetical protein
MLATVPVVARPLGEQARRHHPLINIKSYET